MTAERGVRDPIGRKASQERERQRQSGDGKSRKERKEKRGDEKIPDSIKLKRGREKSPGGNFVFSTMPLHARPRERAAVTYRRVEVHIIEQEDVKSLDWTEEDEEDVRMRRMSASPPPLIGQHHTHSSGAGGDRPILQRTGVILAPDWLRRVQNRSVNSRCSRT
ncbi:hypothetical protein F2P81_023015 [Scophthalmus maximus]|uniref:Uncharacterized protein n=1 Tax=Scophthalmus maximus TaxID=52904 RepID=A0A6A4RQE4_SCOMX|nr:hypothetical protein F2P81_023015 [Scophthalmus maximus]